MVSPETRLARSAMAVRARLWFKLAMDDLGLSGTVPFAELHRKYIKSQLPAWAEDKLDSRLRTFQNVRDKGFDPRKAFVRIKTRDVPHEVPAREHAQQGGNAFVHLPVDLVESMSADAPNAASWFNRPMWDWMSNTRYDADYVGAAVRTELKKLGLVRSRKIGASASIVAMPRPKLTSSGKPNVRVVLPWKSPDPTHDLLQLLIGLVAEAIFFGDLRVIGYNTRHFREWYEKFGRSFVPVDFYDDIRTLVARWVREGELDVYRRFGRLADEYRCLPVLIEDVERAIEFRNRSSGDGS